MSVTIGDRFRRSEHVISKQENKACLKQLKDRDNLIPTERWDLRWTWMLFYLIDYLYAQRKNKVYSVVPDLLISGKLDKILFIL